MDNVTRGLRELLKPLANVPVDELDAPGALGLKGGLTAHEERVLRERLQKFARHYLAETAK
jgi:hypothetical protein